MPKRTYEREKDREVNYYLDKRKTRGLSTPSAIIGTRGAGKSFQTESILRSEQVKAQIKLSEMEALRRDVRTVEAQDRKPKSSILGKAGGFIGAGIGLNLGGKSSPLTNPPFTRTSNTNPFNPNQMGMSQQVRKNQLKRKAYLKAQSLARHDEEEVKIQMKQIKDREAREMREAEENETQIVYKEPDGSKTILKFDENGSLIGREAINESKTKKEDRAKQLEVDKAFIKNHDERRILNKKTGKPLSRKQYADSWATDPRTQKIIRQVSGGS